MHLAKLLSALTVGVSALAITSCSGGGALSPGPKPIAPNGGLTQSLQAVPVFVNWPRPGPAQRVCEDVGPGFARCVAWIRTDIPGHFESPDFTPAGYGPNSLRTAYSLTNASSSGGVGATVAIVDAYDDPKAESDLGVYRSHFGIRACTTANGCFSKVKFAKLSNTGWLRKNRSTSTWHPRSAPIATFCW